MKKLRHSLVSTAIKTRRIARLIYGPLHVNQAYETAARKYQWFRKGDNRFLANGMHGQSGALFFDAFDEGQKELPRDRFVTAFLRDAAHHTRRRFDAPLRSVGAALRAGGR